MVKRKKTLRKAILPSRVKKKKKKTYMIKNITKYLRTSQVYLTKLFDLFESI